MITIIIFFKQEAVKVSSLLPELEKLGIPLYGIVSQKTGAKGFKEYLKGDILLDEEVWASVVPFNFTIIVIAESILLRQILFR